VGTASLLFGVILIIVGSFFGIIGLLWFPSSELSLEGKIFAVLVVPVPTLVVGGLLLRKFDNDRKK